MKSFIENFKQIKKKSIYLESNPNEMFLTVQKVFSLYVLTLHILTFPITFSLVRSFEDFFKIKKYNDLIKYDDLLIYLELKRRQYVLLLQLFHRSEMYNNAKLNNVNDVNDVYRADVRKIFEKMRTNF